MRNVGSRAAVLFFSLKMKMFAWRSEALLVFFLTVSTANPLPRDRDGGKLLLELNVSEVVSYYMNPLAIPGGFNLECVPEKE